MLPTCLRSPALVAAAFVGCLVATGARADDAADQYMVAAAHYSHMRWELAAEEFQVFLDKYPNHAKAGRSLFFLAEALLQLKRYDEADTRFHEYLKRERNGQYARVALFRSGETAYLRGKHAQAETDLEEFRRQYSGDELDAYVLLYLGEIALAEGNAAEAEGLFRRDLARFPQGLLQDDCRLGLAAALEKLGRNEEAQRLYLAVAAKTAGRLADDAQFRLGTLQNSLGDHARAVETFRAFEERLAESPRRSAARLGRGVALRRLGRLDEAQAVFESLVSDPTVGIEARYRLGLNWAAKGDWPAAAHALLGAAAASPQHELIPAIRFHAGDALLRAGRPEEATEQFDQVIALQRADNQWLDEALCGKIRAALETKDYGSLTRHVAEFLRRFPQSPLEFDVRQTLGRSLLEQEQYGRAVETLEALLCDGTESEQLLQVRYLLSLGYRGLERYEDALAALRPVLDSGTLWLKVEAQLTQASLLLAGGKYAEAARPLEALLESQPAPDVAVRAKAQLAVCHAHSGRIPAAKKLYGELLKEAPGSELIPLATQRLADAAYAAGDAAWSARLYGRLAADGDRPERKLAGLSGLGWSQLEAGLLEEAADSFSRVLQKDPHADLAPEAALARGQVLWQLGRHDPALAMFDLVVDRYPQSSEHPKALLAAARLRVQLKQNAQAEVLYQRLVTSYPELAELDAVLYEWSWVLHDLGRVKESSALLARLRSQHRQSTYWADAVYRLAQRAYQTKDYTSARRLLVELLGTRPEDRIRRLALFLRGEVAVAEQKWAEVGPVMKSFIADYAQDPLRLVAEYWIASAAYQRGDYSAAGRQFDDLARRTQGRDEPWLAMVSLGRAQVLAHMKKWNEAYAIASAIEEEFPHFDRQYEVDYLIGRCLASRADFEGARKAYRKAIRKARQLNTETAAMAQWMIGEAYFHQKDYEMALREYLRVVPLYKHPKWQAAALLQAGKCQERLGRSEKAVQLYAELLEAYSHTPYVEEARSRTQIVSKRLAANPPRH